MLGTEPPLSTDKRQQIEGRQHVLEMASDGPNEICGSCANGRTEPMAAVCMSCSKRYMDLEELRVHAADAQDRESSHWHKRRALLLGEAVLYVRRQREALQHSSFSTGQLASILP